MVRDMVRLREEERGMVWQLVGREGGMMWALVDRGGGMMYLWQGVGCVAWQGTGVAKSRTD